MEKKRCYSCMKLKTQPICEYCGYDETTSNGNHRLPAGTILREQYLVGKVLGQGGFGITYLGWDMYLDIPVAIKEYFPTGVVMRETSVSMDVVSCGTDDGTRFQNNKERFLREAKMLARFSQVPEIVQVRNFFLANNTAYIIMEYVEGITLKQYVCDHGGKLGVEETLNILRPMVDALRKVHKTGLIHRDISPDNIMMLPNGGVKLLDFGAVRDVGAVKVGEALTKSTEAILKQGYAPLEQYQKKGSLGPWTDVYALCATVYYCLTGEVPPDAPERVLEYGPLDIRKKVPALSRAQAAALEHGLEVRAEKRIGSMDELYDELFSAPGTKTVRAQEPKPEPKSKPRKPAKKPEPKQEAEQKDPYKISKLQIFLVVILVAAALVLIVVASLDGTTADNDSEAGGISIFTTTVAEGECGDHLTWMLNSDGVLTIRGNGKMDEYYGEWYEEELRQGRIVRPWEDYVNRIKRVVMETGVTTVGSCAFYDCKNLTEVTLCDSIHTIGMDAFLNTGLTAVELPADLKTIGTSAFQNTALTEITLIKGIQEIGDGAFSCTQLKSVVLPSTVVNFNRAFTDCASLESVTIRKENRINYDIWAGSVFAGAAENFVLYSQGNSMAEDYARITGIRYQAKDKAMWEANGQCGDDLTWYYDADTGFLKIDGTGSMWDYSAEERAPWFEFNESIYTLSVGDEVTSIGRWAFADCENLCDLYMGQSVETICWEAFLHSGIDELDLPESVSNIESFAFSHCGNLHYVLLPSNLEVLKQHSFNHCVSLESIFICGNTLIEDANYTPFNQEEYEELPENLTIYGLQNSDAERFANDVGLPFVIGYGGYTAEAEGQCGDDVWWFKSGDTLILYGTGGTWLYRISDEERDDWAIRDWGEDQLEYGNPGFYEFREDIRHIFIVPGVERLGHNLFCDMANLETVDFGTVRETHCTFNNCGIEEVYLPESMSCVGEFMLHFCPNLRVVTIANGSSIVGDGIFAGCTSLEEVWFGGRERIDNGDLMNPNDDAEYSDHVTFYVKPGSEAERYARENDIPYEHYE